LQLAADAAENDNRDQLAMADLWKSRAETVLRPLVRYCGYEAKDQLEPTDLEEEGDEKKSTTPAEIVINFRSKDVALDPYKQLVVLYLKMEQSLASIAHLNDDQCLQLALDLDDALDAVKMEKAQYSTLPTGPAVTAKRDELETLRAYFSFQKLAVWRQQQETRLVGEMDTVEAVHLYDALQQNAQAMADLLSDTAENIQDDPLWLQAQAHVLRIRAFRCYHLARLYEGSLQGSSQQVLALLRQADKLRKRAEEEIAACDDTENQFDSYLTALEELGVAIQAATCRLEATRYLEQNDAGSGYKSDRPLWLRIDDPDSGAVFVDDPPLPIPMPCKPVFFDIAWQHVGASELAVDEIQQLIDDLSPKKGGLLSWFS
jgi:hypothetical protein